MSISELVADVVMTGKQMIMDDISSSVVPPTIRKFNDLHHYVDAHDYVTPEVDLDFDTLVTVADKAAHELDEWIANGFPA